MDPFGFWPDGFLLFAFGGQCSGANSFARAAVPTETYNLSVFVQLESEISDTFLGLLQLPVDSLWIQITGTYEQKYRLRDLPAKENIPVRIQRRMIPKDQF